MNCGILTAMSIELHILPPLFSLPSISGSCIAALSLCNLVLDPSAFKVVESTDLSIGMPALKEGEIWHRGYTNIKSFLSTQHDIDTSLTEMQKADIVAWGSLVEDLGDTLAVHSPDVRLTWTVEHFICVSQELSWRH